MTPADKKTKTPALKTATAKPAASAKKAPAKSGVATGDKQAALAIIDQEKQIFTDASDSIWGFAELSLYETKSAALYEKILKEEGFQVETGISGIDTAFKATYGKGKPVIGILAEYDALSGLSQEAGALERKELVKGGSGHGCGHHMLGAGSMAAAFAVKRWLQKTKKQGTVIFYGCPGEEGGAAKSFMARDGVWKELDAALTWHPGSVNEVVTGSTNACIQTEYKFVGLASHAAGDPHLGRSALDAVELMNIGVQFLREHMADTDRIHYAITETGGPSPNVVQPVAQVLYMVRAHSVKQALALQQRVDKIAEAAAMMTDTTMKKRFIDGLADVVPNYALQKLLHKNFAALGVPSYTEEEKDYAKKLMATYENPRTELPGFGPKFDATIAKEIKAKTKNGTLPLNDFLYPNFESDKQMAGSTDVGDVSWLAPTAQINVVTYASNSPGHSWQNVSCGHTSIAHKGLLHAGKVLAATAIDLFENPALLKEATREFKERTADGYVSATPMDAKPVAIGEPME